MSEQMDTARNWTALAGRDLASAMSALMQGMSADSPLVMRSYLINAHASAQAALECYARALVAVEEAAKNE